MQDHGRGKTTEDGGPARTEHRVIGFVLFNGKVRKCGAFRPTGSNPSPFSSPCEGKES